MKKEKIERKFKDKGWCEQSASEAADIVKNLLEKETKEAYDRGYADGELGDIPDFENKFGIKNYH